jgi:hypothetical protein
MDVIEGLVAELESEIAKGKSWAREYDEACRKLDRACDVIHMFIASESDEFVDCQTIAKQVLKELGR